MSRALLGSRALSGPEADTMYHRLAWLALLTVFVPALPAAGGLAQDEKGTYLGILFRTRTEATPAPMPPANETGKPAAVPRPAGSVRGVVITHVLPGSPADRVDLRRNDVVIGYDRQPIRDGDHLAELIRADKP